MNLHLRTSRAVRIGVLVLLTTLAACGGGGSSDPGAPTNGPASGVDTPSNPNPPPPTAAGFTLTLASQKALILQGTSLTIDATVVRSVGFDGAIDVAVSGLPNGVSAAPISIAAGATHATLTLTAAAAAPHSLPTDATVKGTSGTVAAEQGVTVTVRGVAGSVDTSFGAGGKAVTPVGATDDYAQAMAIQADGKIVVVGWGSIGGNTDFEVVRYLRDGTLDTTFGSAGKVTTPVGTGSDQANAVAIQPDGKILVAGSSDVAPKGKSFALVRLNADGSLDTGFGTGGKVITSFGSQSDEAFAIALQADGKIVLGGHAMGATTNLDFALARYESNGTLDFGFGVNGQVLQPIRAGAVRDSVYALALQTVGTEVKIVAVGGEGDFEIARFNANGMLDNTFGAGGSLDSEFGSVIGAARGVLVAPDNKIVLVGHIGHDFALLQLTANGAADPTFGNGGKVVTPVSTTGNWDEAHAVVRQADGKLVVAGWVYAGVSSSGDFVAARYNADGTLDAGFGNAGLTVTPVAPGTKADEGRAIVLQADERIPTVRSLVAGSANDANNDFAVVRYWH